MKKYILFINCCVLVLFLASCASRDYTDTLSCKTITDSLTSEISDAESYSSYTDEDIKYIFDDISLFEECSFVHSESADNIDEVCVIRAKDKADAKKILKQAEQYINNFKEEKSSFLENYIPSELDKLDCAKAKQFDNYVIFVFADKEDTKDAFECAERILKK
jgi:hypothetical protein